MSKFKGFLAVLAALCVFVFAGRAEATHMRYGNITWSIPNPDTQPRTVAFEVTTAWHKDSFVGTSALQFGDNTSNPSTTGSYVGSGFDAAGKEYEFYRYRVTHTYPTAGQYTAYFSDCCRVQPMGNQPLQDDYRVEAKVDLTPGNTANPVSVIPAMIQMQVNGIRTIQIPAVDPDGTPVTCRLATKAETGMILANSVHPPVINNKAPTLAPSNTPPGCTLTWDTNGGVAGTRYAVQVILESPNPLNNNISSAALDFIIELVQSPVPTCTGSGSFVVDMGQTLTTNVTGTSNSFLTMTSIGSVGSMNPVPGTVKPSPYTATFTWKPVMLDDGTHVVAVIFTNQQNVSGYCTITVTVPECSSYGTPCGGGVGGCFTPGILQCVGPNVECTAVPKDPSPEVCNNIDDDCNGTVDDNNPESGTPCSTPYPSICGPGHNNCNAGVLECVGDIAPGSVAETCNGVDDDCDGQIDDGFGLGVTCSVGEGACEVFGKVICDGPNSTKCSATANDPSLNEKCDGIDNDCDGQTDEGIGLGDACVAGLGECQTSGVNICDAQGGVACTAVPGAPVFEACNDGKDNDCDGTIDNGCGDADGDGLFDGIEELLGTDPNDADSDDDGVIDGDEPLWDEDSDGDGVINALDPDSDDDGLFDGTELGKDCNDPDTAAQLGHCRPDGDVGQTSTDPLNPDSDGDGKSDGSEDPNLNGVVDLDEGNPDNAGDANTTKDFDGDGLGDALEKALGTDEKDADSDDDGLLDGDEANPSDDTDGDGILNVRDVDSDNDALFDGTEAGKGCQHPATNAMAGHCRADGDLGGTKTSPVARDTDRGGVIDGAEDGNLNGVVNAGELDPKDKSDDVDVVDSDGDGLSDALEDALKTGKNDADSDDDGLADGAEPNPSDDTDGDGGINLKDFDADNDGLADGTEAGRSCDGEGTDPEAQKCVADADNGATKTYVLIADTDGGSKNDGAEDANVNGVVDPGETNPLFAGDDVTPPECTQDADCGDASSGMICTDQHCVAGCRAVDGNGCPDGQVCTSTSGAAGQCKSEPPPDNQPEPPPTPEGCGCRTAPAQGGALPLTLTLVAGLLFATRRRRAA
ncbi:MopE-related protein [Polyangium sp. y55x31]|uniref:MopE-related protein n=1 Tax=Polyangium sp. y55x31 TaxID=3042688 RepID=UPI002482E9A8|nr:MopE-related protein [Polyangium sp. y55x31]MDI1477024.1 MopE-related protein [Polyangium sp. y55x31]